MRDAGRQARHLALPGFTPQMQETIAGARVLLVGLGGLGSPAALYLAAAGTGTLVLNDFDTVDLTNLHRQILHGEANLAHAKTDSARETLARINSTTRLIARRERLQDEALLREVELADAVVDGSDNFGTRYALNAACLQAGTPLVSGAAIRFAGHLTVFDPRRADSPCYQCLYAEDAEGMEDCAGNGVLGPVPGVIGSLQAVESLKLLTGLGEPLVGRLLQYDALRGVTRTSRVRRDPACPACGERGRT